MTNSSQSKQSSTGISAKVLIPVDFSPKGELALNVGFELARRLDKEVELIHASTIPDPTDIPQFPDDFNGLDNENSEIEEMELSMEVRAIDEHGMEILKKKINKLQSEGSLPDIKFSTVIAPGMPEEVISEYCAATPPSVVVMATRGRRKRQEELIGSVTAEVIDHCVAPVFTVPEDYTFIGFKDIVRICAFCYFDNEDFNAIDKLMSMFDKPEVKIYLFPATEKIKEEAMTQALQALQQKLQINFPNSDFLIGDTSIGKKLRDQAEELFNTEKIQMILAPNKKRNAISRFFHPGLAHKVLYEIDFPMLAIPV